MRPFPQFSNVTLINPSIGSSSYHAVFVRAQKRFSDGFSLLAHYTFSRYMDDVESANEYGNSGSYMDAYRRNLDWARSASDVPHHFVLTVLYEVPSLQPQAVVNAVLGGWKIGVLETLQSGPPFTVLTTANTTNAFPAGPLRPDLVGNPVLPASEQTLGHWFNTAAFANPAPFTFGNSPRSVLRGPGLATTRSESGEADRPAARSRDRFSSGSLQPAEPDQLQHPGLHAWSSGFRGDLERAVGADGTARRAPEHVGGRPGGFAGTSPHSPSATARARCRWS